MTLAHTQLHTARRLVIKIGSSLLVDKDGKLRRDWLMSLGRDIASIKARGQDVIIVTSGSIALGFRDLGCSARPTQLDDLQAAAALGQVGLIAAYGDALAPHGLKPAQLLITLGDFENRKRYLNARATVSSLMQAGVVPIFNENDTVATAEIRFGDNDRLAARVAQMLHADLLVLLSDIDGLYSENPADNPDAPFIPHVRQINDSIAAMAAPAQSGGIGSGGMVSKLEAAKYAVGAGCAMIIMDGRDTAPLTRLKDGARCTVFDAEGSPLDARKRWIRGLMSPRGFLHIDSGALAALTDGKSLLPVGVTQLAGSFQRGDLVALIGPDDTTIGQGLAAYASDEATQIIGRKISDIVDILGHGGRSALVHRDDLVMF